MTEKERDEEEARHTPGPWSWRNASVEDSNGDITAAGLAGPGEYGDIVLVGYSGQVLIRAPDARLIAAAPELLSAAQQALGTMEWAEANVPKTNLQSDIILLRYAISQALGETK